MQHLVPFLGVQGVIRTFSTKEVSLGVRMVIAKCLLEEQVVFRVDIIITIKRLLPIYKWERNNK